MMTAPAAPQTQAEVEKLMVAGVRDIKGAMKFLGRSRTLTWGIVSRGEVWSFKSGGKRLIPVVELRRYLAAEAMEDL